jgi:hypothetical protein
LLKKESHMASIDEQILKAAKEIAVKFIETGRVSPAGFSETFKTIYRSVEETVKGAAPPEEEKPQGPK